MLSRSLCLTRILLTTGLVAILLPAAYAQRIDDGELALAEKIKPYRKGKLIPDLFKGATLADPKNKTHAEAIELAAKEVTYPLLWTTSASRPKAGEVNRILDEYDRNLADL